MKGGRIKISSEELFLFFSLPPGNTLIKLKGSKMRSFLLRNYVFCAFCECKDTAIPALLLLSSPCYFLFLSLMLEILNLDPVKMGFSKMGCLSFEALRVGGCPYFFTIFLKGCNQELKFPWPSEKNGLYCFNCNFSISGIGNIECVLFPFWVRLLS